MVYMLLYIIIGVFAVVEIVNLITELVHWVFDYKKETKTFLMTPVKGKRPDAEFMLRSLASKVKWMGKFRPTRVICLDCGVDEETKNICLAVCREYPFMEYMTKEEFEEIL